MSEPSLTTSNAEIARQTTCPAGGGGMAALAASQLLDDALRVLVRRDSVISRSIALATNIAPASPPGRGEGRAGGSRLPATGYALSTLSYSRLRRGKKVAPLTPEHNATVATALDRSGVRMLNAPVDRSITMSALDRLFGTARR